MNFVILAVGCFLAEELLTATPPPSWRKATRNMMMATFSMERALGQISPTIDPARTALVVGSNSGELEVSAEFLTTLARTGVARPLFFQNSLHNATVGFAAIHFKLTGPSFAVSVDLDTPGESLRLAQSLLEEGVSDCALVTLVEGHKELATLMGETVQEGAVTALITSEKFAAQRGWAARAKLDLEQWGRPYPQSPRQAPLIAIDTCAFYQQARELA